MSTRFATIVLVLAAIATVGCANYANVPPSDIAMKLTPTGYEEKIYTPGQVDLGVERQGGYGDRLVLIQRSGIEIKEQFIGAAGSEDKEDHRCLTADRAPMTLDVRLLFALPDYERPEGKKDMARLFLLGNPEIVKDVLPEGRVLRISAESVYNDQARQQVRGKIRQICSAYPNFDKAFVSFSDMDEESFTRRIEIAVGTTLAERNVPLRLVNGFVSNMKPDESVTAAIAAKQAADKRVEAIRTLTDFLGQDPAGGRWKVYNMQVLQEIVAKANANGHNTIFMTDIGSGSMPRVVPIPR